MSFTRKQIEGIPNLTFTEENAQLVLGNLNSQWGTTEEADLAALFEQLHMATDKFAAITVPATAKKLYKLGLVAIGLYDPQDFSMTE